LFKKDLPNLIIGRSGAGKSSLLKGLLGLDSVAIKYRKASVDGTLIDRNSLIAWFRNNSIYISQELFYLQGDLSENVALTKKPSNDDISIILDLFSSLELDTDPAMSVENLSGGELQRLNLTRALFHSKSILICDEIDSKLNEELRKKVMNFLVSFAARNKILLLIISHHSYNSIPANVIEIKRKTVNVSK
jgi:ABC-type lipoprotein export system ATPase subunit